MPPASCSTTTTTSTDLSAVDAVQQSVADPTNEDKMRAALSFMQCSTMFVTPEFESKPWNQLNVKLCKEMHIPMILVAWKNSPIEAPLLHGLSVVTVLVLHEHQQSRDADVSRLVQHTWAAFRFLETVVWDAQESRRWQQPLLEATAVANWQQQLLQSHVVQ